MRIGIVAALLFSAAVARADGTPAAPTYATPTPAPVPTLAGPPTDAPPPPVQPPAQAEGKKRFYGFEIFGGAAISAGLFFGGRSLSSKGPKGILITFAFLTGIFSGPLVHHLNGQPDVVAQRSAQIAGASGAAFGLGALFISAQDKTASSTDRGNSALVGIEVGLLAGMCVDALVFGWKSDVHLTPEVTPTHATMSLEGVF